MSDEHKGQQDQQARQGSPTQRAQQQGQGRENQSGPFTTPGPSERPQGSDQRQVNPEQRAQEQRGQQAQAQNPAQPAQSAQLLHPAPNLIQAVQAQTDRASESVELARSYPGKPLGVPMGAEAQQIDAGQQQQEREQQLREKEGDDPSARLKRHLTTAYNFPDNLRQAFGEWIDHVGGGSSGAKPQQQQPSHELRKMMAELWNRVEILARAVADLHAALSSDPAPSSVRRAVAEVELPRPQEDAQGSGGGKK